MAVKLVVCVALAALPYVLMTLHWTSASMSMTHHASGTHLPPTSKSGAQESASLDLSGYWAVIHEANRLLDSLNASTTEASGDAAKFAAKHPPKLAAERSPPRRSNLRKESAVVGDPPKSPKNLVIGLSKDIPTMNLAVFAASLRRHAPASVDLVLFCDEESTDAELVKLAKEYRVDLRTYTVGGLEPTWIRAFHASSFRWPLIAAHLEKSTAVGYGGVLFADVRDTAFQSDPFELLGQQQPDEGAFQAFHGVESRTIGQCGWNGGWVKDCFGEAKLRKLSSKPILCSGVSLATFDVALQYAKQMSAVISHPDFAKCERNGVDQGVHNVLVHEGKVPGAVSLVGQRDALVANLQAKVALIQPDNRVVRPSDRRPVAVVHQYDRFPDLAKHYYAAYGAVLADAPDACARYDVRPNVDLFKAKCDLSATSGTSVHDCCKACSKAPDCRGWTLAGSLCYLKRCDKPATNVRMQGASSGILRRGA